MSEILSLLKELVSRASVTPDDAGCQAAIAARLEGAGFAIRWFNYGGVTNLWATHGAGAPLVCLAGHTDVVPPGPLEAWSSPPFEPTERDGELVGRGTSDMKGSVAAMVVALERAAAVPHPGTYALLLTSDEEGPGTYGTAYVLDRLAEEGVRIDEALVGEPTSERTFGDAIKVGRRGSVHGKLVVHGVQGHTAYPHLARNAAHELAPALSALVGVVWGNGTEFFPPTTLQVTHLESGAGAGNVIPGRAEVHFNLRFGTDWTVDAIRERVAETLAAVGVSSPVEWNVSAYPFLTEHAPMVDRLIAAIEAETGVSPARSTGGGTSDARAFAAHRIPVAEFGPSNATIHAVDERIAIEDLERLAKIYRAWLG